MADIPTEPEVRYFLDSGQIRDYLPLSGATLGVLRAATRGTKSSIDNVSVLDSVFSALPGWSIEPVFVPVSIKGIGDKRDSTAPPELDELIGRYPSVKAGYLRTIRAIGYEDENILEQIEAFHTALKGLIKSESFPRKGDATEGNVYGTIGDVEYQRRVSGDPKRGDWIVAEFDTKLNWAAPGRKISTPTGLRKSFNVVPRKGKLPPGPLTFAMKHGLRELAKEYLESQGIPLKAPTKAEQARSLVNTGTCPVCEQNVKLNASTLIMRHGWQEVGGRRAGEYGNVFHSGSCFGVGYKPWELSPKGAEDYITHLESVIPGQEAALEKLETDPPPFVRERVRRGRNTVTVEHSKGSHGYDYMLRNAKANLRNTIAWLKRDLEGARERVATWKQEPLPGRRGK